MIYAASERRRYTLKNENKIMMHLFGEFYLERDSVRIDRASLHSNKLMKLLVYIIFYRGRRLSRQELIDLFWEDDSRNPAGALKNLMYRLRTILKEFGDEEYILTYSGSYQWNPDISVDTDYEQFEELSSQILVQKDARIRKEMCQQVVEGYQIDIAEKLAGETWILPKLIWFRSRYMDVIKCLCEIYEAEGDWKSLEILCRKALEVDSMEEDIHCWQIRSLYRQKKYDLAMSHYEQVSRMLYNNLGIKETEKLHSVFVDMMAEGEDSYTGNIKKLLEEVKEPETPKSVFFCDYQVFRQIYRVEARRLKRMCLSEYILLITIKRRKKQNEISTSDKGITRGMEILEELLKKSLRIGDVVARYSLSQYIVLLPMCSYESGILVAERLRHSFDYAKGKLQMDLQYELEEISHL